jgi:hypothetical protein
MACKAVLWVYVGKLSIVLGIDGPKRWAVTCREALLYTIYVEWLFWVV